MQLFQKNVKRFGCRIFLAGMALALLVCGAGCLRGGEFDETEAMMERSTSGRPLSEGTTYRDISENFDITVFPARLYVENGKKYIEYQVDVINDSKNSIKDFEMAIVLSPDFDTYLKEENSYMLGTKLDLAPLSGNERTEEWGKSTESNYIFELKSDAQLKKLGLEYADVLVLGKGFELWMQWDGGEERHRFTVDVMDELQG